MCKKYKKLMVISIIILAINWNGVYQLLNLLRMYLLGQLVVEIKDISWIVPSTATSIFSYLLWKVTKINFGYEIKRFSKERQSVFILVLIKLAHLKTSLSIGLNEGVLVFDHDITRDILLSKEIETILIQSIIKHLDTFESFDAYLNNFMSDIDMLQTYFEIEKSNRTIKKETKYNMGKEDLKKFQDIVNNLNEKVSSIEIFLSTEYEKMYKRSIFTVKIK